MSEECCNTNRSLSNDVGHHGHKQDGHDHDLTGGNPGNRFICESPSFHKLDWNFGFNSKTSRIRRQWKFSPWTSNLLTMSRQTCNRAFELSAWQGALKLSWMPSTHGSWYQNSVLFTSDPLWSSDGEALVILVRYFVSKYSLKSPGNLFLKISLVEWFDSVETSRANRRLFLDQTFI